MLCLRARWTLGLLGGLAAGCTTTPESPDVALDVARFDTAVERPTPVPDALAPESGLDVAPVLDVTFFDVAADGAFDAPTDASGDAAYTRCAQLAEQYAVGVRAAQQCSATADCGALVCETLCCACSVYVNPANPSYRPLESSQALWRALGCAELIPCTAMPCVPAAASECSPTLGRCVTVRRPPGGG